MKKSLLKSLLILAIVAVMVAGPVMNVFADDTATANKKMAYNIYADPDVSKTSKKFNSFSIDFYSDETPINTYWSLANFGLDLSSKKNFLKYPALSGGGAYAGLQERGDGSKVSIMAFWEMRYSGTKIHNVKRMYPSGDSNFTGEGDGKNCIAPYAWTDANWYRMILHTWDDVETGTTFVGQWVQDLTTKEWHLACYFDTGLYESCLIGGMGLFMENYWAGLNQWTNVRSFRTKNIYVNDKKDGLWKSLNTVNISYGNGGADNKMGAHTFGATDEYFWGSAGGLVEGQGDGVYVEPQKTYEQNSVKSKKLTITQPDQPTFGTPSLKTLTLDGNTISWELSKTDTPQLSYKLEIIGADGKTILTKEESRPEISTVTLDELKTDAYKATLTVTDLFGSTTTLEKTTEAYDKAPATPTPTPEPTPEETNTPATTTPADTTPAETKPANNTPIIVACVAGVIVVIGVAIVVAVIAKNKKKK